MDTLITGANRGIGAALRREMMGRGHRVTGTHRGAKGDGWLSFDATKPESIEAFRRETSIKPPDCLVSNAGVYLDKGHDISDGFDPALWEQTFAVNVTGVFETIKACLPALKTHETAKIAIISSRMGSQELATGGSYIYRASKAAALNLGRNLAIDLKDQGIAVGIYHPGWVQTDMGGADAAITDVVSAAGLADRLEALSLATTGCFENYDGTPLAF